MNISAFDLHRFGEGLSACEQFCENIEFFVSFENEACWKKFSVTIYSHNMLEQIFLPTWDSVALLEKSIVLKNYSEETIKKQIQEIINNCPRTNEEKAYKYLSQYFVPLDNTQTKSASYTCESIHFPDTSRWNTIDWEYFDLKLPVVYKNRSTNEIFDSHYRVISSRYLFEQESSYIKQALVLKYFDENLIRRHVPSP